MFELLLHLLNTLSPIPLLKVTDVARVFQENMVRFILLASLKLTATSCNAGGQSQWRKVTV